MGKGSGDYSPCVQQSGLFAGAMNTGPNVMAECPRTGEYVFPLISHLYIDSRPFIVCPSCQRKHRWIPTAGILVDSPSDAEPDAGSAVEAL
jgi:hypothetical protein